MRTSVVLPTVAVFMALFLSATSHSATITAEAPDDFFGYVLPFDAISAAGGYASGAGSLLGLTVGQPVVGLSASGYYETVGFWRPGILRELDVGEPVRPFAFALMPIAPNPATRSARIHYIIPGSPGGHLEASVRVFDVSGRLVRVLASGPHSAGDYTVAWDGLNSAGARLGAGAFFVELEAGANRTVRRVILLR